MMQNYVKKHNFLLILKDQILVEKKMKIMEILKKMDFINEESLKIQN